MNENSTSIRLPYIIKKMFLFAQAWPEDALERVAFKFLETVEMEEKERVDVVDICKHFHTSARALSER